MTWAEKVKQRDSMKCVVCGRTDRLQAHHVKPTFLYPEYKNDINNGVTLCKACHQRQHGGDFSGYKLLPVDGIDPDPEGRMEAYTKERRRRQEEKNMVYVVWGTNKQNGEIVFEAAEKAGQCPSNYIGEAVYMRLKADGFDPDKSLFINEWKEKRREEKKKIQKQLMPGAIEK